MCGIAGCVYSGNELSASWLDEAISKLWHRGPDTVGRGLLESYTTGHPGHGYHLGQTRLAICDVDPIATPYQYDYLQVVLAFNGEIYNWKELQAELSDGTPWQSSCDAEVVARAWRRWGPECLSRFNGMFAMAIADQLTGDVVLVRDRAGVKPLYYLQTPGRLYFASEAKALPGPRYECDCEDVDALEFDCGSRTPFEGVFVLPPGTLLVLNPSDHELPPTVIPSAWWKMPTDIDSGMTWESAVDELEALVCDAVRIRMTPEVPVAQLLSGGLDSAILQAVSGTDAKYCVTFDPDTAGSTRFDVLAEARAAARDTAVTPVTFSCDDFVSAMPDIVCALDTPAIWTAAAQWFLFQQIRRDGYKVVLSGEGADELFCGYARYRVLWHLDRMRDDRALAEYGPTIETALGPQGVGAAPAKALLYRGTLPHPTAAIHRLFQQHGRHNLVRSLANTEFHSTMQVLLRILDRMSMASGIEARTPFLDYRIVEFSARCPTEFLVTARESKAVLREVARRVGVPRSITDCVSKKGFTIPWPAWRHRIAEELGEDVPENAVRGAWDRGLFVRWQKKLWRQAFNLSAPE